MIFVSFSPAGITYCMRYETGMVSFLWNKPYASAVRSFFVSVYSISFPIERILCIGGKDLFLTASHKGRLDLRFFLEIVYRLYIDNLFYMMYNIYCR